LSFVRARFTRNPPHPLRIFGLTAMTIVFVVSLTTKPEPGLHGKGPLVILGLVAYLVGLGLSVPARPLSEPRRIVGLVTVAAAGVLLTAVQPNGAMFGAIYYVVIVSALVLDVVPALVISVVAVAAECVVVGFTADDPVSTIVGVMLSIIPWFLVMRLVGQLDDGRERAEALVEELRETRDAAAESAALAERGRVARDMHDVLAHSLSALALQLEGTRLLARERGADPSVIAAVERAHHLAGEGLAEARDAIAALRGEELPGPERLQQLVDAFAGSSELVVTGTPRELGSEARLALYRTAQEALTNVLRHSAADRVEVRLEYLADATRLVVQDYGPGAPVAVGAAAGAVSGGGYGLTGMRERAELLGGRLHAAPTPDGFRVDLWLPA
jgi:signal transduction histidine kinase